MTLASIAACVVNAIRMGIDAEDIEVTVRNEIDPRVLFAVSGPEEHERCIGPVEYDVRVSGDISDEQRETIRDLCRHSPVYGMVAEPVEFVA